MLGERVATLVAGLGMRQGHPGAIGRVALRDRVGITGLPSRDPVVTDIATPSTRGLIVQVTLCPPRDGAQALLGLRRPARDRRARRYPDGVVGRGRARGRDAGQVRLRDRRRRLRPREGHLRGVAGDPPQGARARRVAPEVRPLPQRRPGHDEPVPARRGVRHRGRGRDRPRPRPLRALHRREPVADLQRHHRRGLRRGHQEGAARRLPRGHRAGDPARHRRDQGAHPPGGGQLERRGGRHRDRRDGRRHRVAAVPRGDPAAAQRRRASARLLRARDPGALPRLRRRAQDQDDPALGQRAAAHRHRAGRAGAALEPAADGRHPREDRALRRHPGRGGDLGGQRRRHLRGAAQPARPRGSRGS